MKFTINEKACKRYKLTPAEVLAALSVRMSTDYMGMMKSLFDKKVIVKKLDTVHIAEHWDNIINEILCDSSVSERSEEQLIELAEKIQNIFPRKKMINRQGKETPYYYRCNKAEIKKHLVMFFNGYGNVSDEDVLDATKRYVEINARSDYRNMRLAKYFIWKNDRKPFDDETVHVEQLSDLATYLENKGSEESVEFNPDLPDFTMQAV